MDNVDYLRHSMIVYSSVNIMIVQYSEGVGTLNGTARQAYK